MLISIEIQHDIIDLWKWLNNVQKIQQIINKGQLKWIQVKLETGEFSKL